MPAYPELGGVEGHGGCWVSFFTFSIIALDFPLWARLPANSGDQGMGPDSEGPTSHGGRQIRLASWYNKLQSDKGNRWISAHFFLARPCSAAPVDGL